jgi:hypothetical protein
MHVSALLTKLSMSAGPLRRRSPDARGKASPRLPTLLCQLSGEEIQYVSLGQAGAGEPCGAGLITGPVDAAAVLACLGRRRRVIAVLPRSYYLVRSLTLPAMGEEELSSAIRLKVEAGLPRDFGPLEVGYRLLSHDGALCTYEAYVSRRGELDNYLEALAGRGIRPDLVMPSAAVWPRALRLSGTDVMVAFSPSTGYVEAALTAGDAGVSVRMLQRTGDELGSEGSARLSECFRSSLADSPEDRGVRELSVGWLGGGHAALALGDSIHLRDVTGEYALPSWKSPKDGQSCEPLLLILARCLSQDDGGRPCEEANLLPRDEVHYRKRLALYKVLAVASGLAILAVAAIYAALLIASVRYARLNDRLVARTSDIRAEGERVERRVSQLKTILDAEVSGKGFSRILSALAEATPKGVTYSQVSLYDTGEVQLRGNAESVSLPFLLPEMLLREGTFGQAVLTTAGQQKQGAGSTTEFRMDCVLAKGGTK